MLYGRGLESDKVDALFAGAAAGRGGVLVVRGEPGVGKTALLADATSRAADVHSADTRFRVRVAAGVFCAPPAAATCPSLSRSSLSRSGWTRRPLALCSMNKREAHS